MTRSSADRVPLLALAVALLPYAALVLRYDFLCDDAYISFRYSRHLAEGQGLSFNPGEVPPVEGYSNFLWVLWLSVFEGLGIQAGTAARISSIACGVALLGLVARTVRMRLALDASWTVASTVFLACLPSVGLWSTGGLESMPFALAVFGVFERLCGDPRRPRGIQAGLCAAAAALLRADGAVWAGLALAAAGTDALAHRSRDLARAALQALGVLAAATAVHALWRHGYHGEWLPNTARVKAGLSAMRLERGAKYVAGFLLAVPVCALVPVAAALLVLGRERPWARGRDRSSATLPCLVVIAGAALYSIFVGGDFMPMGRFLLPAMPFVAILFGVVLQRLAQRARSAAVSFAGACIVLALLPSLDIHPVPASIRERVHFRWNDPQTRSELEVWTGMRERAEVWALLGRALARHTQPGESIVLGNVGAVGYFSELYIHDVFGLVSPEVARREAPLARASPGHEKVVEPEFFFDRRPTYLNAWLAREGAPTDSGMPESWRAHLSSGRAILERVPLSPAEGFPPGVELRLLRLVWKD